MKTLKKTLCFVLAVVMVVGVMAMSASAISYNDYTDKDEIKHGVAVEVLTAIGVINGDGDSFNPKGNLTRAQAAKIISYILMGQPSASQLSSISTKFPDVPADHWASGDVAYCSSKNIIDGFENGEFQPNGMVTGTQFAKMLLSAMASLEVIKAGTYTGDQWATNVQLDAVAYKLTTDLKDLAWNKPISRDDACQMAFNAMTYGTKVETAEKKEYFIVKGDKVGSVDSKQWTLSADEKLGPFASRTEAIGYAATVVDLIGKNNATYTNYKIDESKTSATSHVDSIGYKVFKLEEVQRTGSNGIPESGWEATKTDNLPDKKITGNVKPSGVSKTYNYDVTSKTIFADLGLTEKKTADVFEDGKANGTVSIEATSNTAVGKNGVRTDVYYINGKVTVVRTHYYLGKVVGVSSATNPNGGITTTWTLSYHTETTTVRKGYTEGLDGYKQGDYVVFTLNSKDKIASTEQPVVVSGAYSRRVGGVANATEVGKATFTIGGTAYKASVTSFAYSANASDKEALNKALANPTGTNVNILGVNVEGVTYLMQGIAEGQTPTKYILVLASDTLTYTGDWMGATSTTYGQIYGLTSSGEEVTTTARYPKNTDEKAAADSIWTYKVNEDGTYELTGKVGELASGGTAYVNTSYRGPVVPAGIENGTISKATHITGADGTTTIKAITYTFNGATTYVFYTQGKDGAAVVNKDVRVGNTRSGKIPAGATVVGICTDATSSSEKATAAVVFIKANYTAPGSVANVAWVDKGSQSVTTEGGTTTYSYSACTADGTVLTLSKTTSAIARSGIYEYNTDNTISGDPKTNSGGTDKNTDPSSYTAPGYIFNAVVVDIDASGSLVTLQSFLPSSVSDPLGSAGVQFNLGSTVIGLDGQAKTLSKGDTVAAVFTGTAAAKTLTLNTVWVLKGKDGEKPAIVNNGGTTQVKTADVAKLPDGAYIIENADPDVTNGWQLAEKPLAFKVDTTGMSSTDVILMFIDASGNKVCKAEMQFSSSHKGLTWLDAKSVNSDGYLTQGSGYEISKDNGKTWSQPKKDPSSDGDISDAEALTLKVNETYTWQWIKKSDNSVISEGLVTIPDYR